MKTFKRKALPFSVITGLSVLVTANALAATLEEIVVTAQKRQESAQDVGMSITAITGDSLTNNGVSTPNDLSKVVAGFVYTKTPRGTPVYSMRGIGFGAITRSGVQGI